MIFRHLLNMRSHPTWVRGLKPPCLTLIPLLLVAPYVGAWIETELRVRDLMRPASHPTWVRGLKLPSCSRSSKSACRTLRGCVD